MVAINIWSFHGRSIIGTTDGSHNSLLPFVCNMCLQGASALLVSFTEGSLDGVSVTSRASLNFGFFGLAGDACGHSIVLTALRLSPLTGSGAFGSLSSPSSCLAAEAFVRVSTEPSSKSKNLNCIENLSPLKNGWLSSTHLRERRAAASVVALLELQSEPVIDTSISRSRSRLKLWSAPTDSDTVLHSLRNKSFACLLLHCSYSPFNDSSSKARRNCWDTSPLAGTP